MDLRLAILLSSFALFATLAAAGNGVFNVDNYGAKGNGQTDDTKAFLAAWLDACAAPGNPKLYIPYRKYLVGVLKFVGPCKGSSMTIQLEGTLLGTTNLGKYPGQEWVLISWVNNLKIGGGGTFDGQGQSAWPYNSCRRAIGNCKVLPPNVKIAFCNNVDISSIKSLNPKMFHYALLNNNNIRMSNLLIQAPEDSPNTDGIHMEGCNGVQILDSKIGTGDDCVSVGQGNKNVYVKGIQCGPGHGISVGSLGKYQNEKEVNGLVVTQCSFKNTMYGARIKSLASNIPSYARNITYDNLIMSGVTFPIMIDQTYCPGNNCGNKNPSHVAIKDVTFSNIKGTSTMPEAVTMRCSSKNWCQNVQLKKIDIRASGGSSKSVCVNVKPGYSQVFNPGPCAKM